MTPEDQRLNEVWINNLFTSDEVESLRHFLRVELDRGLYVSYEFDPTKPIILKQEHYGPDSDTDPDNDETIYLNLLENYNLPFEVRRSFIKAANEDRKNIRFIINPPPSDGRCECCGRSKEELKPFGKAGDPLVGDFNGALLVKTFRRDGPYNEEAVKALDEADENCGDMDLMEYLIDKYGKEKGKDLYFSGMLYSTICKSWECRDCIILDMDEYFKVLYSQETSD